MMNFNTPLFLFLFLPAAFVLYTLAHGRGKLITGIAGSLVFFAWGNLQYVPWFVGLILLNYFAGKKIDQLRGSRAGFWVLFASVFVNLAVLILFKIWTQIPAPLGLSYVIFQLLAYLLEINKKAGNTADDLLQFSFYILLFPKIIVGPIARFSALKAQIQNLSATPAQMADGARRFMRGLAKKALLADTLARLVNPVFSLDTPNVPPAWAWLTLIAYALQLYFDFSGYTDMALGLGQMMGLKFMENFNFPYISKNIGDFWRRWHISLSNWFRDFVFYPLERRRLKFFGQQINVLIVFLLTGLWHGFRAHFMVWGLLHGAALIFEATALGRKLKQTWAPVQHIYALFVILLGWVFFRSPSLSYAFDFLERLAGNFNGLKALPFSQTAPYPFLEPTIVMAIVIGVIFSLPVAQWVDRALAPYRAKSKAFTLAAQFGYDLALLFLMAAAVAAAVSANFMPGIYTNF